MSRIYEWVKNIVFFYILMTAALHLLPKSSYQKYVRFFGGLLLVVLLLTPLLEPLSSPDSLRKEISYEAFRQQTDNVRLDTKDLERGQREACRKEYEKAIGIDVAQMAEEEELTVQSVQVELNGEYEISAIAMEVKLAGREEGIHVEKIILKDNSREYPTVARLKKKLTEVYKIEENQIRIKVQEG